MATVVVTMDILSPQPSRPHLIVHIVTNLPLPILSPLPTPKLTLRPHTMHLLRSPTTLLPLSPILAMRLPPPLTTLPILLPAVTTTPLQRLRIPLIPPPLPILPIPHLLRDMGSIFMIMAKAIHHNRPPIHHHKAISTRSLLIHLPLIPLPIFLDLLIPRSPIPRPPPLPLTPIPMSPLLLTMLSHTLTRHILNPLPLLLLLLVLLLLHLVVRHLTPPCLIIFVTPVLSFLINQPPLILPVQRVVTMTVLLPSRSLLLRFVSSPSSAASSIDAFPHHSRDNVPSSVIQSHNQCR